MSIYLRKPYSFKKRVLFKNTIFLFLVFLLGCAATIPFIYESQSLWYKFGTSKVVLRMGKIAGLFAAILLLFQILLAIRLPIFDKIFGLDKVSLIHRTNGLLILTLVILHVSLVIIPEGLDNLPIGSKFWPEMIGMAMFFILLFTTLSALFRSRLLPYHRWRFLHRALGYLLFAGTVLHILYVSDSFEQSVPKLSLLVLSISVLFSIIIIKYKYHQQAQSRWQVEAIQPLNDEVVSLVVKPPSSFSFAPGQFAFLGLIGPDGLTEPHPFTIASAPTGGKTIRFIIKKSGDWTRRLERAVADKASLQGPFGLFSYQAQKKAEQMVFIAAGIGITPMLSMLHHISTEEKQPPRITLIWTVRHDKDMFLHSEIENLKNTIPSLVIHIIYTHGNSSGRLNRGLLKDLLKSYDASSHIYICGPPQMMEQTGNHLVSLKFKEKNIFIEKFSL